MASVFLLGGPRGTGSVKKTKPKSKGKRKHNLALGECVCVLNGRTKRRTKLCNTGKGKSGHQFVKGGC